MKIVFATAEPYGAYHLSPFVELAKEKNLDIKHLLPSTGSLQGSAFDTTINFNDFLAADCVAVTGGELRPWTNLVALEANRRGIPVIFCELAYVPENPSFVSLPSFDLVTASTSSSAEILEKYLNHSDVKVVGSPQLDSTPKWKPSASSILIVPAVAEDCPDNGLHLKQTAYLLVQSGWEVTVRPHPRENPAFWEGFMLDRSSSMSEAAASAQVVLGHPGTAVNVCLAVGVPFVSLLAGGWEETNVPEKLIEASTVCNRLEEVLEAVKNPQSPSKDLVESFCGPIGGSAARILDLLQ